MTRDFIILISYNINTSPNISIHVSTVEVEVNLIAVVIETNPQSHNEKL